MPVIVVVTTASGRTTRMDEHVDPIFVARLGLPQLAPAPGAPA